MHRICQNKFIPVKVPTYYSFFLKVFHYIATHTICYALFWPARSKSPANLVCNRCKLARYFFLVNAFSVNSVDQKFRAKLSQTCVSFRVADPNSVRSDPRRNNLVDWIPGCTVCTLASSPMDILILSLRKSLSLKVGMSFCRSLSLASLSTVEPASQSCIRKGIRMLKIKFMSVNKFDQYKNCFFNRVNYLPPDFLVNIERYRY